MLLRIVLFLVMFAGSVGFGVYGMVTENMNRRMRGERPLGVVAWTLTLVFWAFCLWGFWLLTFEPLPPA